MATRKVKAAPVEGTVTKKQAKAAVKAVMEKKRDPGTIISDNRLQELKQAWEEQYNSGMFRKEDILSCVQALTDRILSGEIVPEGVDKQ